MEKIIDFNKSIFELVEQYPQIINIMHDIGFKNIVNPAMIKTVGRYMTIKTGAKMKRIDVDSIKKEFQKYDFIIKE